MKRSVVIQKQYLFKHPGPEDGPAQGLFPQLRGGASVDRRKDAHAAAEGLPDPGEVGGTCDLVHGQPLRVHPAQQHLHACGLRAAGEHVRVRAEVELRHAMHRTRQLQPLVHNADAAARRRKRADAAAQQRRLAAAGAAGQQTGGR